MQEEEEDDEVEPALESSSVKEVLQNGTTRKQAKKPVQESPASKQNTSKPKKQEAIEKTDNAKNVAKGTPKQEKAEASRSQPKQLEGGVVIEDLKVGTGDVAKPGKMIQVYYEGRLKNNNKMFDSARVGPGFKFRLGRHEVIKGWDVGIVGMKVGGKRKVTCPPNMA